jgi:hypothetical protein
MTQKLALLTLIQVDRKRHGWDKSSPLWWMVSLINVVRLQEEKLFPHSNPLSLFYFST